AAFFMERRTAQSLSWNLRPEVPNVPRSLAMVRHTFSWIAIAGVLLAGACAVRGAEPDPELVAAEKIVKAARMSSDGPSLLDYIRKRTRPAPDRATLADLI